jgi:hypothetical protein
MAGADFSSAVTLAAATRMAKMPALDQLILLIEQNCWQDAALSAGNIFFCFTLIPMLDWAHRRQLQGMGLRRFQRSNLKRGIVEILLFLIMLEQADAKRDAKVGHGDNYRPMLLADVGEEGVTVRHHDRFERLSDRSCCAHDLGLARRQSSTNLFCKSVTRQSSQIRSLPCERATS